MNDMPWSRRAFLAGAGSLAALPRGARAAGSAADAPPLTVILELPDGPLRFDAPAGRDLGDIQGPGFVQRSILASQPDRPFHVLFRPDRGSDRIEVVVELGGVRPGGPLARPMHAPAYQAHIRMGDRELARVAVPRQFWQARWRWQSAPRPVTADPAKLIAAGLLPPYDLAGQRPAAPVRPQRYEIMGLAGLEPYMPATGERPDIGMLTEAQAEYVLTGRRGAYDTMIAQAEASGTVPWHMRDLDTGAPVDFFAHPKLHWYPDHDAADGNAVPVMTADVTPDAAHTPALAYLPYLLTGDPYYLEELQFCWSWCFGSYPPDYRLGANPRPLSVPVQQARAQAWTMRSLMQLARMTPERTPAWLLPRRYFQRHLDIERDYLIEKFVHGRDPLKAVFETTVPETRPNDVVGLWQDDYQVNVFAWAVRLGFDGFRPVFAWKIASNIARSNGRNGWRPYCVPYEAVLRNPPGGPYARSWAEAWEWSRPLYAKRWPMTDPNHWANPDATYLQYMRAALAQARRLGVPEADACYAWADGELRRVGRPVDWRWAVA